MGMLKQWRRIVTGLMTPTAVDAPSPLPTDWRQMSSEALWTALRMSARFEQPDPRAEELLASGRPLDSLPLAQWALRHAPAQAPALFAAVGYDLRLFERFGTPEGLYEALLALPAEWSAHPVDTLAKTPGWTAVSRRGATWFGMLATWAASHIPQQPADRTTTESTLVDEGVARITRLVAQDASDPRATAPDEMALLYTLVSDARWAQWVRAVRGPVVHWERYRRWDSEEQTPRFVPATGWPPEVPHGATTVLLSHPLQALAHDQLWGSSHGAQAYTLRGARRWYQSLPKADHRVVLRALATWPGANPGALPAGLDAAALLDIFGHVPSEAVGHFLKSPERTRREIGIKLMSLAAGPRGPKRG